MVIYTVIVLLGTFLVGYLIGKRQGWEAGYHAAEVFTPLSMREQALKTGQCVVCGALWIKTSNCESFSRDLDTL
jgi:UPF0716 family protein affecting phage T7 exclusion